MSFAVVTDATANVPTKLAKKLGIEIIPFSYFVGSEEFVCADTDKFECRAYYDSIRAGTKVTTAQINPQRYVDFFRPLLEQGSDVLFIGLSSGISGSFASAAMAREELLAEFPGRSIRLIDSLGASLGEGLLALRAASCRSNGMTLDETADRVAGIRDRTYQVFIVDDLMHLRRTGRLSNISAVIGSVLGIKPLLKGNEEGKIVAFEKIRGRRQAIDAMAQKYITLAKDAAAQLIGISHCDCPEDAKYLADLIRRKLAPRELLIVEHEPVTGSHIGPGALALYFEGGSDVRLQ